MTQLVTIFTYYAYSVFTAGLASAIFFWWINKMVEVKTSRMDLVHAALLWPLYLLMYLFALFAMFMDWRDSRDD